MSEKKKDTDKTSKTSEVKENSSEELFDVEELAKSEGLTKWQSAALMVAAGWTKGKKVSQANFKKVLFAFEKRCQGGGRLHL